MIIPSDPVGVWDATHPFWKILGAALASGGVLHGLLVAVRKALEHKREKRYEASYRNIMEMYETIHRLRSGLGSTRVMFLRCENGGGIPAPGGQVYSSVVAEACASEELHVRDEWQKRLVDRQYARMLTDVFDNGFVLLKTKSMLAGPLRDLYQRDSIESSVILRVAQVDGAFFYLGITFAEKVASLKSFSPTDRTLMNNGANRLRRMLAKTSRVLRAEGTLQ